MTTEVFVLTCNGKKSYLHVDRTYKYGGLMLLADFLQDSIAGIVGFTYFAEFNLDIWLRTLGVTDTVITLEVDNDCDGDINSTISNAKKNDVLTLTIKENVVTEIKNSNDDIIYTLGDDEIEEWGVGWFGKVFDYYTGRISYDIENYEEYVTIIWGVYYG